MLLHVEETSSVDISEVKKDAVQTQQAQLALRDDEITRLRIENDLMLSKIFPRLLASAQQVTIAGAATNVIIAGSGAVIHNQHRVDSSPQILALVREMLQRRTEATPGYEAELGRAAQTVQHELSSDKPKESVVAKALGVLKEVATKTATSAGEKLITEHWQTWAHQLEHFIKLLGQ